MKTEELSSQSTVLPAAGKDVGGAATSPTNMGISATIAFIFIHVPLVVKGQGMVKIYRPYIHISNILFLLPLNSESKESESESFF